MADDKKKRTTPRNRDRKAPVPSAVSDDDLLLENLAPSAPPVAASTPPAPTAPTPVVRSPEPEPAPAPEPEPGKDADGGSPVDDDAAEPEPDAAPRSPRKAPWGKTELISLAGFAVISLVTTILFFKYLYRSPIAAPETEAPAAFAVPLKGTALTVAEVAMKWRPRTEADRVKPGEVVLPEATVTLGSGSGNGFLRIEFVDSEGTVRGDIFTATIEGGRFKDTGRGEHVSADGSQLTMAGTEGFSAETVFAAYLGGMERRWTVRLREGADYSAGPWTTLGEARIPDRSN